MAISVVASLAALFVVANGSECSVSGTVRDRDFTMNIDDVSVDCCAQIKESYAEQKEQLTPCSVGKHYSGQACQTMKGTIPGSANALFMISSFESLTATPLAASGSSIFETLMATPLVASGSGCSISKKTSHTVTNVDVDVDEKCCAQVKESMDKGSYATIPCTVGAHYSTQYCMLGGGTFGSGSSNLAMTSLQRGPAAGHAAMEKCNAYFTEHQDEYAKESEERRIEGPSCMQNIFWAFKQDYPSCKPQARCGSECRHVMDKFTMDVLNECIPADKFPVTHKGSLCQMDARETKCTSNLAMTSFVDYTMTVAIGAVAGATFAGVALHVVGRQQPAHQSQLLG